MSSDEVRVNAKLSPGSALQVRLRAADARQEALLVPGVFDCMTAMLAAAAGFEVVYIGSYATSLHRFGLPDLGYIGRSDLSENIRRVADVVDVPIIADAEAGFGNAVHVAATVRAFERAGAAGLHLEDHEFGKHLTGRPVISSRDRASDRIRAAVDARADDDFVIIARTDAQLSREMTLEDVIDRLQHYAAAGADMVFAPGLLPSQFEQVSRAMPVPLVNDPVGLSGRSPSLTEMWEDGVRLALYGTIATSLAFAAVSAGFAELLQSGLTPTLREKLTEMIELDRFLNVARVRDEAAAYNVLDAEQLSVGFWPT